jgi:hypothetical protein
MAVPPQARAQVWGTAACAQAILPAALLKAAAQLARQQQGAGRCCQGQRAQAGHGRRLPPTCPRQAGSQSASAAAPCTPSAAAAPRARVRLLHCHCRPLVLLPLLPRPPSASSYLPRSPAPTSCASLNCWQGRRVLWPAALQLLPSPWTGLPRLGRAPQPLLLRAVPDSAPPSPHVCRPPSPRRRFAVASHTPFAARPSAAPRCDPG